MLQFGLMESSAWHSGVLDPHGPVAGAERTILLNATVIMLAVIVPVIVLTLVFAWWFRASNRHARYLPDWAYSGPMEIVVWSIPLLVVLFLSGIAWIGSHDLDPAKPLANEAAPLEVQVISLDWKWLFIYPSLGIASVNRLPVPTATPLHLRLTSASVMNSFFVPQLGSQIYTMAGMVTKLNLQADRAGVYPGISAQFSGQGFSDMRFDTVAMPQAEFEQWVAKTKSTKLVLNTASYAQLAQSGVVVDQAAYSSVTADLFSEVVNGSTMLTTTHTMHNAAVTH